MSLVVFGASTLATLVLAIPLQMLVLPWDPGRSVAARVARWTWSLAHFWLQPLWTVRMTGSGRAVSRGQVVIANHQSMLDIPLLMSLPAPVRVIARGGVFEMPVFGYMAKFGRHILLSPDAPGGIGNAIEEARAFLGRGVSVLVFPEGTRSDGRSLLPFQRGAFEFAIRSGADILPVCIRGTADALPKGSVWPRIVWPRMHVQVLSPISSRGGSRRELARQTRAAIEAAFVGPDLFAVSDAVGSRYRGRFASGFARGKTRSDPVYWAAWERLPREGLLVDVGCGEGLLGAWLRECGSRVQVWGVDVDAARVRRAPAGDYVHLEVGDARIVAFPPAAAVVCLDMLHYLPLSDQDALIARMAACLEPGGMLLLRDPERGRGLRSAWTEGAERVFVALGRHRGEGVTARGGAALAEVMGRHLVEVRYEDCSVGPFANVVVSGRRAMGV